MLKIRRVKKRYGTFALECSLEVKKGSITGLVGENGAGKSTLFKMILGLAFPDSGDISLFGKSPEKFGSKDREKIGVVLAGSGMNRYLKAGDMQEMLKAMYSRFDEEYYRGMCGKFCIPLDRPVKDFSTGMKSKMKLVCAVSHGADFLLLDEPTAGLDVVSRRMVQDLLRRYMEEDDARSILISSHIASDLEGLCDDIYVLHEGNIILHESMDTLLTEYGLVKTDPVQYGKVEREYILKIRREAYGYDCLTGQKQFFRENYPELVVEDINLEEVVAMLTGGG
ncbi:ABC transporter ATP-binding protein [Lachnoclostridium sp. An169]|uniref:ABC transporter ATP-binding protein n=1 Tax=Lachnoclostridium sp. An169 TaxID=1965569 RepID=UPI000B372D0D|nr:ABC transporter ATP-binding protein [Lachnoclostridium sp. An169]OUP86250.1 ABC transporter ATP-binding protein [Lachnoclostridium sp. An169]HJA67626.1 ABC transporter ATP-binding protein [Candidatus Mediterraneibacter cottocaccae]